MHTRDAHIVGHYALDAEIGAGECIGYRDGAE
jgi:hypothetical protein